MLLNSSASFRTPSITHAAYTTLGGREVFKIARRIVLTKMATSTRFARKTTSLPPTKHRRFVTFTPLRSVPHHKLCSGTRPPAHTMG